MYRRRVVSFWEDYFPYPQIGAAIIVVGLLIWLIVALVNGVNEHRYTDIRNGYDTQIQQAIGRISTAFQEVSRRREDFLPKYSAGLGQQLEEAGSHLNAVYQTGPENIGLMVQLDQAIADHDWKQAKSVADQLATLIQQDVTGLIDRILGPPNTTGQGLYDILAAKVAAIDAGLVDTVQNEINQAQAYVGDMPTKFLCESTNRLSYQSATDQLTQAQSQLEAARITQATIVDNLMADKPLAYDQAVTARNTASFATSTANSLSAGADNAPVQINQCGAQISYAQTYLLTHSYRFAEAQAQLVLANGEYSAALDSCYVQDFAAVSSHVSSCVSFANAAIWFATEPTPTPRPLPTIDTSSDDDDNSWSSSDDSGSWDSGSDSGSWDSGGSDSGSWDSPSDSGSWDSDSGSDSGSW